MVEESDESAGEPNLELPSLLGFRRRRRERKATEADQTEQPSVPEEPAADDAVEETAVIEQPAVEEPGPATAADPVEATQPIGRVEAAPTPEPAPAPPPPVAEPEPVPTAEPEALDPPLVADPVEPPSPFQRPDPEVPAEQTAVFVPGPVTPAGAAEEGAEQSPGEPAARERATLTLPVIDPRLAAVIAGALVGLVAVVLASLAGNGCEAVRGVGSCGGVGLFALLAVLAVGVVLGAAVLRALHVTDPLGTSFLGVGVMAVIALLFFLGSLESVWMFVVVPVLTALTFLLSWWVTETFVDGTGEEMHR